MKARFLAITALILGMVSCQKDQAGLDVMVDGEQETTITVSLPEATRANSAEGAIDNNVLNEYDLRYILEIYDEDETCIKRMVKVEGESTSTAFDVRLIPGYPYTFVAWADFVKNLSEEDNYYNTANGLTAVTANDLYSANDATDAYMIEARDAYTGKYFEDSYNSASNITLELKRPFAKLRVITTDVEVLKNLGNVKTTNVSVDYRTEVYTGFDALNEKANTPVNLAAFDYDPYVYAEVTNTNLTLLADYLFGTESGTIQFDLTATFSNGKQTSTNFNTDIPLYRNKVTTITGNILTDGNDIKVDVKDNFDNPNGNDPNYEFTTISSDKEFLDAVNNVNGGKYIVISDLHIAKAGDTVNTLSASAPTGKTVLINLNGKTITVDNKSNSAVVNLGNDATLIFAGEGDIVAAANSNKLVDGGQVVVTGAAEVDTAAAEVVAGVDALKYIVANGGEFTMTKNIELTEVLLASSTNPIVVNGNDFSLSSAQNRIVRITNSNANVTFNDVDFVSSAVMIYPSDVRGVSIDAQLSNVTLTLNNCTIDFTDKTTNDWTYAVNVSGNGTGHKVTINGGTYEGANVVNVHGAKNTIVVKNATLNCLYPYNDLYSGACIWVLQNQESSVYAEGNIFNGDNAIAFNLGTGTTLEEKNNTDNTKFIAVKVGKTYYYNVAEAIDAAADGATVKVLQSHTCTVGATVANGKTLTLDLNGKTITGTESSTGSYALITNKGNLTITGNGKMTLKAENNREWNAYSSVISNTVGGKLVVENGTIEHLGGTDMAYGIDNLTNGKGTYAETVINGGTIKSPYRAVRMFLNGIEAQNLLTVNGGIIEGANKSIWMQDPSKNANTGKLVVAAGAKLQGDAYLSVTAGSTEWPVEVSIADDAFEGESTLLSNNVPAGYEVVNKGGVWTVIGYTEVSTADELIAALEAKKSVKFLNDIKIEPAAMSNAYGTTGINVKNGQTIDGNGYTLNIKGAGGTWDSGINTTGGLIKNLIVTGSFRGIFINHTSNYSEKVVLENVTIGGNGTVYTISCDQGLYQTIEATNCTFNGWTSFAKDAGEAKFVNCSFGEGGGYKYCRPYSNTEFVNCTFCPGFAVDTTRATVTFTDCTWDIHKH